MLIELQPIGSILNRTSVGISVAVLLIAIGLYVQSKREGKYIQAVAEPLLLLIAFIGLVRHELNKVYSLEHRDKTLVLTTQLGTISTTCSNIEFMIRRGRGGCDVQGYRGNERLFQSVEVDHTRCAALPEQLGQIPCKPSDTHLHITNAKP